MIRPGEPWGEPTTAEPDLIVTGGDRALADAVEAQAGLLVRFVPDATSDLARAVGLAPGRAPTGVAVPMDVLRLADGRIAVNLLVAGVAPDALRWWHRARIPADGGAPPATTLIVAIGQFRNGLDLVPRGHPGDGRSELHRYAVQPRQRGAMRSRLPTGTHAPHPAITTRSARAIDAALAGAPVELDGRPAGHLDRLVAEVLPGWYRLLL